MASIVKAAEQFKQGIADKHGANKAKNAYNQTEEGMTRAQMKKEAKRLMYLQSTEAAPEMGDIKKLAKKGGPQRYYPGGMAFPGGAKSKKAFWGLAGGGASRKWALESVCRLRERGSLH